MRLNEISPTSGARRGRRRVGRGIGSGLGKTAGRGHKGQKSRAGGFHKVGFEGGQMPLQRRLPKRGFVQNKRQVTVEIGLSDLARIGMYEIDVDALRNNRLIRKTAKAVRVILAGKIEKAVYLKGIEASKGARAAIEAMGGSVDDKLAR